MNAEGPAGSRVTSLVACQNEAKSDTQTLQTSREQLQYIAHHPHTRIAGLAQRQETLSRALAGRQSTGVLYGSGASGSQGRQSGIASLAGSLMTQQGKQMPTLIHDRHLWSSAGGSSKLGRRSP